MIARKETENTNLIFFVSNGEIKKKKQQRRTLGQLDCFFILISSQMTRSVNPSNNGGILQFILTLAQGVGGTEAHKPPDGNY